MDAWTLIAYIYFVIENANFVLAVSSIIGAIVVVMFCIGVNDTVSDDDVKERLWWKAIKWYLVLLAATIFTNVIVPDREQMRTLVGIEIAARTARSEDAQRIAKKGADALERLIDKLAVEKEKAKEH